MNKLSFTVVVIILLTSTIAFTQDTIVKNNGEQIECTILEITPTLVKFIKLNSEEETALRLKLEDIWKIKYENGETTVFVNPQEKDLQLTVKNGFVGLRIKRGGDNISASEIKKLYSNHETSLSKYKSGKTLAAIGNIIGFSSGFVFGWNLSKSISGTGTNKEALIISGVGLFVGTLMVITGERKIKESIKLYNANINNATSLSLNMGFTPSGIGLCLSF